MLGSLFTANNEACYTSKWRFDAFFWPANEDLLGLPMKLLVRLFMANNEAFN